MHFAEIEKIVIYILKEAGGKYLFPYQIFLRLKIKDLLLAKRIEAEYPVRPGKPSMGEGAGIYYSPASFVAHALSYVHGRKTYPLLDKQWFDAIDIEIVGIIPGNKEATSIWAWDPKG